MAKPHKLKAQLPRGFADLEAADLDAFAAMSAKTEAVFRRYGFARIETPAIEYTEALGKFLPDADRPNEGVFSFQDEDEQWLSLRYDLTAPLARYVAQNFDALPKPFRSYRFGPVFRNEKPGPGRFRQFLQFDADTVGSASPAADAEMCMIMADTLEALGLKRGEYIIKLNNRRILDEVMEAAGLGGDENVSKRLGVMRAIDKFDRLGAQGVKDLLGKGRKDQSGDFTVGVKLPHAAIDRIIAAFEGVCVADSRGVAELAAISGLCRAAGYEDNRIRLAPSIVRGLDYYTGAVFEAELTFPVKNDKGQEVVFGSVAGGGRYDGLIARFRGEPVPATGFSIGVSRLLAALKSRGLVGATLAKGPVVICTALGMLMEKALQLAQALRSAGIAAEVYLGSSSKLGNQLAYASKRGSPCAIIQGDDERAKGEVIVRDMAAGTQETAAEGRLIDCVAAILRKR